MVEPVFHDRVDKALLVPEVVIQRRGPHPRAITDSADGRRRTLRGIEHVVTAEVAGYFPGSPVRLGFGFTLSGDHIAALVIAPR